MTLINKLNNNYYYCHLIYNRTVEFILHFILVTSMWILLMKAVHLLGMVHQERSAFAKLAPNFGTKIIFSDTIWTRILC